MALNPKVLQGWPPGGWQFYQPETDWHAPAPLENNFDRQTDNIAAMRALNPAKNLPSDKPTCAADLQAYTEVRLAKTYSRAGMAKFLAGAPMPVGEAKKKVFSGTPRGKSAFGRVAEAVANVDSASLEDWLGAGGRSVPTEHAIGRALICRECKANEKTNWWQFLTVAAAKTIRGYLSVKNRVNLRTPIDSELGKCGACDCILELKIWQPPEFVKENTDEETMAKHRASNAGCWVVKESA